MEPILIGAALGAGTSGIMGGDPLKGAVLGGAGGGFGGLAGGAGGAASGAAGGATSGAGSAGLLGATSPTLTGATTGALSGYTLPGSAAAITAPVTATATPITTSSLGIGAGSGLGPTLSAAQTGVMKGAALGDGVSSFERMMPMARNLMKGTQQEQPQQMSAPQMRRGQDPKVFSPVEELMRMQMMAQRQRRPISLL